MMNKLPDPKKPRAYKNRGGKSRISTPTSSKIAINPLDNNAAASYVSATIGVVGPVGIPQPVDNQLFTAINAAPPVAGTPNFSGTWILDKDKSDSTNDYLEAMGLPLIARQAADKLDLTVVIRQTIADFIITRKTKIFTETKPLKFGQEMLIKDNTVCLINIKGNTVETVSRLPANKGVLLDTRTLEENNQVMHVLLELNLPDKKSVVTHRYFNKVSDSTVLEDEEDTGDDSTDIATTKRKR